MIEYDATFINAENLPIVVTPKKGSATLEEFYELLEGKKDVFQSFILTYGGVLFRGFPLEGNEHFSKAIEKLELGSFVNYIGGDSPRDKVKGNVYTSTELPPWVNLPLHNEMSFVKNYPKNIYFFCDVEPEVGGSTTIANARTILEKVDQEVKGRLEQKEIQYLSCYYGKSMMMDFVNRLQRSHKSWKEVFETDDPKEVEERCQQNDFGFKWCPQGWLRVSQKRPSAIVHPTTGEKSWFNQIHLYDFNPRLLGKWAYAGAKIFYFRKYTRLHEVAYGDGSPIPREHIYHVMDVLEENTISYPWKRGDFLALDNVLTMHGRAPFQGKRRILTAMTS